MVDLNSFDSNNLLAQNKLVMLPGDKLNIKEIHNTFGVEGEEVNNDNPEIVSYSSGEIKALTEGESKLIFSLGNDNYYYVYVNVIDKLMSDKYEIDYDNKYLYVADDSDEEIKSNLLIDNIFYFCTWCELDDYNNQDEINECIEEMNGEKNAGYQFKINNDILKVVLAGNGEYIPIKYNLGRIDLSKYSVNGKTISADSFDIDDIECSNIILEYKDNTLIIKDLDGNEIDRYSVNTGNNIITHNNIDNKTTLNKFEDNAKTYDDIMKYFIIGGIAVVLIIGIVIYTKKK